MSADGSTKSKVVDESPNLYIEIGVQEERDDDAYQICHKLERSKAISTAIIVTIPRRKNLTHLPDLFIPSLLPFGDVVEVSDDGPRGIDRRAESGAGENEGEGEDDLNKIHSSTSSGMNTSMSSKSSSEMDTNV